MARRRGGAGPVRAGRSRRPTELGIRRGRLSLHVLRPTAERLGTLVAAISWNTRGHRPRGSSTSDVARNASCSTPAPGVELFSGRGPVGGGAGSSRRSGRSRSSSSRRRQGSSRSRSCGRRAGWDGRRRRDGAVDAWNWRDRHTSRSRYGTSSSVVLSCFLARHRRCQPGQRPLVRFFAPTPI
jgi:hypothetical protein